MHDNPRLALLAERHGVGIEYWDWTGAHVQVAPDTLIAVLAALDVDASSDAAIEHALADVEDRDWRRTLPQSVIVRAGASAHIPVHVPDGETVRVEVVLEDGTRRLLEPVDAWVAPRVVDGALRGRATVEVPAGLPKGWHELRATIGDADAPSASATLAVVPQAADVDAHRVWGLMAQLYQVRSAASWGVGDLADARGLAQWGAEQGADFLLLNPLHAPAPVLPIEPSPYLPTTRRFVDPSVVRIDDLPAISRLDADGARRVRELAREASARNVVDDIDRDAMWSAKREALERCFEVDLRSTDRARAFGDFCEREGQGLVDFASYCAIAERFGRDWGAWPAKLQHPSLPGVASFRDEHAGRVDFYRWLQFTVDEQLSALHGNALEAGMRMGIVHDLAVGVHPQGADAWALPDALARGVSVGAPPDAFNQLGQNWSQPPWRPDRLAELGYAPYRDMLRTILRHAGGVRIDHILGLFRLWWIPIGASADQGAYVTYDHEAMLGVLLLEAERAGARVIGEDLGVVAEHTRATLAERGIAGTSILWWEWGEDGPLEPEHYRLACLAAVTTHDLPPTAGYLELVHVALRERLGLLTRSADDEREAERASIGRVMDRLVERGLMTTDAGVEERVLALHRYLASSFANTLGVAVADLAGDRRSVNQPGTYREYPNWSVPLSGPDGALVSLETLIASPFAATLAEASRRDQSRD